MTRRAKIKAQFSQQIRDAAGRFRDHETMSAERVLKWVEQFDDGDLDCGIRVLQRTRYYSAPEIRQLLRRLVTLAYQRLEGIPRNKVYFVPVGRPGGGANIIARALDDIPGVRPNQIKHMLELDKLQASQIGGIVFLDDFSGTGNSLVDWWSNVEMMVRPKNAPFVVAVLILNQLAQEKIKQFATEVVGAEHLLENDNALSALSDLFNDAQKEAIFAYCKKTKCEAVFERGFGNCGLLIAFRHGCPNNSLPILWYTSSTWRPLFRRRAM
jgi:hypothetical protein